MISYPSIVRKIQALISRFTAADLNAPIEDLEKRTDFLKQELEVLQLDKSRLELIGQPIENTVNNFTMVYNNGTKWEQVSAIVQAGNEVDDFALGMAINKRGNSGNFQADIVMFGLIEGVDSALLLETGSPVIGQPYFLSASTAGRLTPTRPSSSIFAGYFLANNVFLMNIQFLHYSHIHRKIRLGQNWVVNGPELLYPIDFLPQLPLPFEGVGLNFAEIIQPIYGVTFVVDQTGIRLTDTTNLEGFFGAPIIDVLNDPSFPVEMWYSDPRTLQVPGVSTLEAGTDNIILENKIQGSPTTSGSLIIKNVPTIQVVDEDQDGESVVKDILSDATTGNIQVIKGPAITELIAGDNIVITDTNVISSTFSKEVEMPFYDIALRGAMSKRIPNSITTYIEYTHLRETSAIFTAVLPRNLDATQDLVVYGHFFATLTVDTEVDVPFEVRYTVLTQTSLVSDSPIITTVSIPLRERNRNVRRPILTIPGNQLAQSGTLSVEIARPVNAVYENAVGLQVATHTYSLR